MLLQLNWNDIADLLINANDTIVLCMPSIHEEWIMAIERNAKRSKLKVKVCIENSETVVRNGYGSITSIDKLKKLKAIKIFQILYKYKNIHYSKVNILKKLKKINFHQTNF